MKALKDLYDMLTTIPFVGIIINIFTGGFGVIVPLAFALQVALQITCACLFLNLGSAGTIAVAFALCCSHLFTGLLISLQPLSGMGPKPTYKTERDFERLAAWISVVFGGGLTVVVVAIAAFCSGSSFAAATYTVGLSVFGALLVHMFGVVFPIIRASRQ